jgi:hypothetical protein
MQVMQPATIQGARQRLRALRMTRYGYGSMHVSGLTCCHTPSMSVTYPLVPQSDVNAGSGELWNLKRLSAAVVAVAVRRALRFLRACRGLVASILSSSLCLSACCDAHNGAQHRPGKLGWIHLDRVVPNNARGPYLCLCWPGAWIMVLLSICISQLLYAGLRSSACMYLWTTYVISDHPHRYQEATLTHTC